jgi:hypothetical protein
MSEIGYRGILIDRRADIEPWSAWHGLDLGAEELSGRDESEALSRHLAEGRPVTGRRLSASSLADLADSLKASS